MCIIVCAHVSAHAENGCKFMTERVSCPRAFYAVRVLWVADSGLALLRIDSRTVRTRDDAEL